VTAGGLDALAKLALIWEKMFAGESHHVAGNQLHRGGSYLRLLVTDRALGPSGAGLHALATHRWIRGVNRALSTLLSVETCESFYHLPLELARMVIVARLAGFRRESPAAEPLAPLKCT
jgi:hypothetical protein